MAEYEISHPRIPQIGNTVLEGPDDLPPPTERDFWDVVQQQVRPFGLSQLTDEEKISAYKNGYFDDPKPVEGQPEQPGIVDSLLDLGGKAALRGSQMMNALTLGKIGHSGPYDKLLKLEDEAVSYEKTENADQFREAGKYLFGFLDNTEEELDFDPVAEALKRTGMPFYSKNKDARGRVKTAAMDYAQESMVAGMGEGYARAASGGEFLYKGGKFLKDKLFLDEADDSDILDYVNSAIEFDALNHRYENSAELAAFVLENPQESVKAMGAGVVGGLTPIVEAEDLNEILIDEEDINLDSDLQQDIRSGFVQPDVGFSFLSEVIGDPMNLAGGTTAKAVTAPQRVALSGKITQTLNEVTKLNQGKSMAIRALEKFPEDSLIAQRQAKYLEAVNQSLAQKQKVLDKYARNSMFLRMAAQSSPDELLKVAAQNIDTASDAGKASMNMVYNAMKPSGKMGIARKGIAMGAKLTPEIAGATIGASLAGPEGAALGAITPSLIKAAKIVSTMPENIAISYIMRSAAEAGEEITEQAARKQWRGITKYLYPTGILGIGIGSATDGREEGGSNALLKFGAGALSLKALPKIAKLADAAMRDSRIIGPELIYARGSEASPFFNRLALLPSGEEGLIGANADRFQALTRTPSGETILEKAIDKVRPIGRGVATSVTDEFPTGAPFRPGLSDTNKMLSNPTRKVAQFLDRNPALGRSIETLGRFGTVATAGSTLPAAFGYVGSGGQTEGAIAGALVSAPFTSIGAGAGMFQAYKNKSDLFQQKMGDVYYYREHLNKSEQADFDKLPMEARMGLAGYSLSHPDILFKPLPADKLEGQGNWSFDENTGTSIVRFDKDTGAGLVEGVLAHEVGHHIEIHGLTPMVNKIFFGDQVTGEAGLYGKLNEDGEIVPNQAFEDLRTLYLNRLTKDASIKPENLDQYQGKEGNEIIAKEIFAETVRDYLLSGKKNKGNTAIEKMITSASNAMMGTSFVRDFLIKFNLPMKADGKFIEGGPFEGTLERNPALTKLIDQYYSDTRALRQREIQGDEITTPGSGRVDKKLSVDGRRPIGGDDFESSFSLKDQNDPAIKAKLDTGGIFKWRPTADGKGSELETGATGTPKRYTAGELKKEQRIQGDHAIKVFEDNGIEIITNKEGKKSTGDITNLTSKMIDELAAGPWHPRQIQTLREISRSLREGDGERAGFLIGYFAASSGRKPKAVPFTLRQEMPYGFQLTNDGNILVLLHDVPQLEKNLKFLKGGKRLPGKYRREYQDLFGNDTEVWKAFQQYRINTANGMDGQLGLDDKPAKAMRKKNFLNALHGAIDKEHIKLNPILLEISNLKGMDMFNPKKTSPFGPATKTFRLDRIFDVTRSGNRNSNVNLDRVRTLLMPRQSKNFDKKVALRTNESLIDLVDKIAKEEGVSRNDVLNRILQEKLDPETKIELPENVPADPSPIAEEIPPKNVTPKVESRTPSIPWSKGSDPSLNWLRNSPDKKLFMPAETVDPNVRRANKYARQFKAAQKNDKIIIKEAREEWRDLGFESENFQEFMRGNETGIPPVLADEKAGNYIPKKMYYTGQIGTPQGANYDRSIDVVKMVRDKVDNRESHRWNPDETIILTQDRKRAREIQKEIDPEHIPLVMATNAKYIFDVTNPEHLSVLKNHISEIPNKQISSEKEMLVQRPGMINPDIITKDAEFDYKPTDLPTDYSNVNLFENELKSNGWHGYKFTDSKGEHFAIFDSRRVKLIEDQSAESKVYSKDRPFGKVSGLFGKQIPSDRMSSVPKRDIRFMPQMELNFGDGKTNPISADNLSNDISKPISFWDIFNIDKNGKNVYPQVAEALINTGDEYMDWQTAADYAPRLNLDVKKLRQEMRLAQKRNNSSGKYFLPKLPTYKKDGKTFKIPLPPTSPDAPRAYHGSKKKYDYPDEKYLGSFTKNLGYIGMGYYGHPKRFDAEMYAATGTKSLYSFEMLPEGQSLNAHLRVGEQHPSIQKNLEKLFETKVSGTGQKLKDLWAKFYTENPTRFVDEMLRSDDDIYGGQINPEINKNIGNKIYMGLVNLYSKSPVEKVGYLATSSDNIAAASTVNKILTDHSIKGAISFSHEGAQGRQISPEVVIFDFNEIRDFRKERSKLFMPAAYHGTPHTLAPEAGAPLGRFRTSKIGTGEGAQAYGHGLYFAGKRDVAEHYRKTLSGNIDESFLKYDGQPFDLSNPKHEAARMLSREAKALGKSKDQVRPRLISLTRERIQGGGLHPFVRERIKNVLKVLENKQEAKTNEGSLYKVELAPKDNEYLLWDKPLSEQPKGVREKLIQDEKLFKELESVHKKVKEEHNDRKDYDGQTQEFKDLTNKQQQIIDELGGIIHPSWTGANIYHKLTGQIPGRTLKLNQDANTNTQQAASQFLKEAGIPGIKYLDGSSRSKGEGDYNYVIFDEADVTVTDKLFMPASEAGATKGKIPKSGDMLTLDDSSLKLFLPSPSNPNASLSEFKGKNVQVLTADLSVVGDKKADGAMISFTGGPGYLSVNDAWGFTNEAGAKAFKTRWERDGKPLIGITSMKQENHRASTLTREYYVRKFMEAINDGKISENTVNRHIKTALKRAIDGKNGLTNNQKAALKTVKTIEDFLKVFPDKELIPWKATPMIYGKLDAKTLPIKQDRLKKLGLDTDTILRETRQPEYNDIKKGSLLAIAEYDGSGATYRPDLNSAYPWSIPLNEKAFLKDFADIQDLSSRQDLRGSDGEANMAVAMGAGVMLDKLGRGDVSFMPADPKAKAQPANRITRQAPAMPGNRFMAPAASAGAKLSERFGK